MAKILVIDDEKSIRDTLKEILEYEDRSVSQDETLCSVEGFTLSRSAGIMV